MLRNYLAGHIVRCQKSIYSDVLSVERQTFLTPPCNIVPYQKAKILSLLDLFVFSLPQTLKYPTVNQMLAEFISCLT